MDLKRFFLSKNLNIGETAELDGSEFHHMKNVVRHKEGDSVILLNGDGYDYLAQIAGMGKKSALLRITDKTKNPNAPKLKLTVLCGLLKGEGSENQAAALSELGVYKFIPFISQYCAAGYGENKNERLARKALESAKQCKRAYPMEVSPIVKFEEALLSVKDIPLKIMAYENERQSHLKDALKGIGQEAALVIGPEGGFSPGEAEYAAKLGFKAVTLGRIILKAETAATACTAAVMFGAGEWDL
jgi:16S rRNA (uracil1498-N3)-methyltransferase